MIRYNYIAQHPQPQHQHLLVKISHRRVWCASGAANTRSDCKDCHTVPTVVQTDQWLLTLTFIRLYWSSCIDIDTQMRQPSTSRGKVSINQKSIMTECMQHTASHDSRLGFSRFIFFAHLLTHWNSVLSQNTCRVPNTQLLTPASAVCCKRSLVWWSLSRVIFYVMEFDLVRGMLQQKSQRGRREGKWLEYVLCFYGDDKMAVEQFFGF